MADTELNWLGIYAHQADYAAHLLLRAAATGNPQAQAQLGQILLDGRGIQQDPALAYRWFGIAAAAGHIPARNMLGRCLQMGWGCTVDLGAAAEHYRLAAATGYDWAQYNYANMLAKGWGVTRDMPAALAHYQQAAAQGHAKAMNLVGRFFEEGWVVAVDADAAFSWYHRSALAGDFRGQCSYASMLTSQGRLGEAVAWLRRAMHLATPAFLLNMASALRTSAHACLREIGEEMRARAQLSPPASAYAHSGQAGGSQPTA